LVTLPVNVLPARVLTSSARDQALRPKRTTSRGVARRRCIIRDLSEPEAQARAALACASGSEHEIQKGAWEGDPRRPRSHQSLTRLPLGGARDVAEVVFNRLAVAGRHAAGQLLQGPGLLPRRQLAPLVHELLHFLRVNAAGAAVVGNVAVRHRT